MTAPLLSAVLPVAESYRLALLSAPASARAGDVLSRRTGGSVEIEDFRPYVPGDDLRHIDWAAYARSDQYFVRLHRAEVRLSVEILLDRSVSMTTGEGTKERRARELAFLFARLGARAGAAVRIWGLADRLERLEGDPALALEHVAFDGRAPLPDALAGRADRFEAGSVRIAISDFLFPHDPESLHAQLARTAGGLALVQVLGPEELEPPLGTAQLVDVETGEDRPLWIDARAIRAYRERLAGLIDGLRQACRRTGAPFASTSSARTLDEICRRELTPPRVLEPA